MSVNKACCSFVGLVLLWLLCMLEEGKDQLVNYSNIYLLRIVSGLLWYIAFSVTAEFGLFMLFQSESNPSFLWVDWLVLIHRSSNMFVLQ